MTAAAHLLLQISRPRVCDIGQRPQQSASSFPLRRHRPVQRTTPSSPTGRCQNARSVARNDVTRLPRVLGNIEQYDVRAAGGASARAPVGAARALELLAQLYQAAQCPPHNGRIPVACTSHVHGAAARSARAGTGRARTVAFWLLAQCSPALFTCTCRKQLCATSSRRLRLKLGQ